MFYPKFQVSLCFRWVTETVNGERNRWNDQNCTERRRFLCRHPITRENATFLTSEIFAAVASLLLTALLMGVVVWTKECNQVHRLKKRSRDLRLQLEVFEKDSVPLRC